MESLSHLNERGEASMVDVGGKPVQRREAVARGCIHLAEATQAAIVDRGLPKGDVLAVARIAGIQAAKRTADLIPLCHPLPLTQVAVDFDSEAIAGAIVITCRVRTDAKTGVEMEALTGVSVAALTIYDMCKSKDRSMVIGEIALWEKTGGRSGHFKRDGAAKQL
jgi:cyclic pyranopterin phosphate synthase